MNTFGHVSTGRRFLRSVDRLRVAHRAWLLARGGCKQHRRAAFLLWIISASLGHLGCSAPGPPGAGAPVQTAVAQSNRRWQDQSHRALPRAEHARETGRWPREATRNDAPDRPRRAVYDPNVVPCQALGPAAPYCIGGVDSTDACDGREARWGAARVIPWQAFAQGEYTGHARTAHVPEYRLRVDDQLEFRYRLTREETGKPYRLSVGDRLRIESLTDEKLNREVTVQPGGNITLLILGEVHVTRRTVTQVRDDVERLYRRYYKVPAMTVTPLETNMKLTDLIKSVDATAGTGGQQITARVAPDGTVALPAIGSSVPAQGLTLEEMKDEIVRRYARVAKIEGLDVTPRLVERAPRYIYVLGEVNEPGRKVLEGPTTAMGAISLAGSWKIGGNLRQIIIFRRGDDWRLMATRLDLQGALLGARPGPADEIWLNDSDIVVVPKHPVQILDDWIEMIFTRGVYGVIPFQGINLNFSKLSSI